MSMYLRFKVTYKGDRDYAPEANGLRKAYSGQVGRWAGSSNAHGLTHKILFDDDTEAWFDDDELEEIP